MPRPGHGHPPPAGEMTVAELGAAVAALPGKRDALREAFDRLAACSPSPLPFAWEDVDAHLSSLQSSISLRFCQVRALEAARPAPNAAAPGETRGDGTGENLEEEKEMVEVVEEVVEEEEEVVEVEVEEEVEEEEEKADEDMQEGGDDEADDKIGKDGKDEEASDEVLQEEEVEEVTDDRIGNDIKDDNEAMGEEKNSDEEMQVVNEEVQSSEDAEKAFQEKEDDANMEQQSREDRKIGSQDKEDASMEDEQDTGVEEAVTTKAPAMQGKEEEACGVKQEKEEEQKAREEEEGSKNVTTEETAVAEEVSQDQGNRALPGGFSDRTAACANMDAQRIVKLLFTNTGLNLEFHAALHRAPDAAALALHVVELFLHDKMLKTNKAWVNCVGLIRMVPVVVTELSADMIEQAKPVAMDWKEMIDNSECCTVLGSLASWAFLYFIISYNIVSEFETKEIFHLFATMPSKQQKMNYAMLFKDLRLTDRILGLHLFCRVNGLSDRKWAANGCFILGTCF
ncbi:hypothetical protein GQ55_9G170100 [Panicum hallii var. hallii]|uniref:FRIGIDA-like protein n=1 Tax=Panicum hallii var. hallii TaxID=1504633 RepID=A0A2T7C443_9POAL|nr:hypothetical protein GQ55_9G170100 [Panicum hallii var. hallii]